MTSDDSDRAASTDIGALLDGLIAALPEVSGVGSARDALHEARRHSTGEAHTLHARRARVGALSVAAQHLVAAAHVEVAGPVVHLLRVEAYRLASDAFAEPWALAVTALSERLTGVLAHAAADLEAAAAAYGTSLWMHTLLEDPADPERMRGLLAARTSLGRVLIERGELEEAERQLLQATELGDALLEGGSDPELRAEVASAWAARAGLHEAEGASGAAWQARRRSEALRTSGSSS